MIQSYTLYAASARHADGDLVEKWPRTAEGAISAVNRAARLSATTRLPHEVRLPDGSVLVRYVDGERDDKRAEL